MSNRSATIACILLVTLALAGCGAGSVHCHQKGKKGCLQHTTSGFFPSFVGGGSRGSATDSGSSGDSHPVEVPPVEIHPVVVDR